MDEIWTRQRDRSARRHCGASALFGDDEVDAEPSAAPAYMRAATPWWSATIPFDVTLHSTSMGEAPAELTTIRYIKRYCAASTAISYRSVFYLRESGNPGLGLDRFRSIQLRHCERPKAIHRRDIGLL
jgi:hypothetical protein